ncbi:MAG: hypothetical protein ACI8X5_000251 [Planctomycetota bacterium]|jgi:hypothetical protein
MSELLGEPCIESTLPKPWEDERTFNDILYEWMARAPWLAISATTHLMAFLLLAVIPWNIFDQEEMSVVQTTIDLPVEDIFDEPEVEPEEPIELEEPEDEPTPTDAEVSDHVETDTDQEFAESEGDPDLQAELPFTNDSINSILGIGGNPGGKAGGRFGGNRDLRSKGGSGTEPAVLEGLNWLALHQDSDGKWDADGFMKHDSAADQSSGPGHAEHDVGVTGLALLAFMGDGHTTRQGLHKDRVVRGIKWLRDQQDFENGLIGDKIGTSFLYDHGIATLALCEAYYFSKSPILRPNAQKAINFVTTARNPYGVWRYDVPPSGGNDTSVTGWMVFALKSAEESGLKIDSQAFGDSLAWFDEVSDPQSGRVGYSEVGEPSSRTPGVNDQYPREKGEAMTAVGLLCRFFLGQTPAEQPIMKKHAELIVKTVPEWDDEKGLSNDLYYWYYGTYAMYQMGGRYWKAWNKAMKAALIDSQAKSGAAKGSWIPNGPWGHAGGRVYSTALSVLCLEVYFRYSRILGSR